MYLGIALGALFSLSSALYTPKGSSCAVACGTKAQNFTGTGDLVCLDTAYDDNTKGVLFKQCISCLSNSTYINDAVSYNGNSDQYWYLWHIKYVQQYCLVDTPQTAAAENCASQCNPMKTPLDVSWIYNKAGVQPQYGYCGWNSSQYTTYAKDCATCLQGQEGGVIIGNLADTTYNACKSQPQVEDGGMVVASRDLFDSSIVNETTPTSSTSTASESTSTASSTSHSSIGLATDGATATTSTNAASTSSTAASTVPSTSGGLSSGASAGIGVGAALVVLALAAGLFFVFHRKKKAAPAQENFTQLPSYVELGNSGQVNEIGSGEKGWVKVSEVDAKSIQPQELDGSGR